MLASRLQGRCGDRHKNQDAGHSTVILESDLCIYLLTSIIMVLFVYVDRDSRKTIKIM